MRRTIFICLMLMANVTFAQKNIIKGRAFALPIMGFNYSLGLGYERMIADNFSVQVLYNNYGYDWSNSDGGSTYTKGLVPEARFYFGKKDSFRKKMFVGVFTELLRANDRTSTPGETANGYLQGAVRKMINPGILFGTNASLGKRWHFDLYIGWKYKFINKTEEYFNNGATVYYESNQQESGYRVGVNLGYAF